MDPQQLALYRARLAWLAARGVYVGTSSWKYPGWLGQLYSRARYEFRGRFALSRFEKECLREYAETFRTVCVDAAYYTWPSARSLEELAEQVPDGFRFAFKVTDTVTIRRFPDLPRFGPRAGTLNEHFLNASLFSDLFLKPLEAIKEKVGPVIFEFSKFHASEYAEGAAFVADLDRFLRALPKGPPYAVELRNRSWLGADYLACLRRHDVAHVLNNWTQMPAVGEQVGVVGENRTEESTVARFLLKPGRGYEQAVKSFQPYEKTQEVNEEARSAGAALIERGALKPTRKGTFIYVNNRLEGNALMSIQAMLEKLTVLPPPAELPVKATPPPSVAPAPQLDLGL